MSNLILISHPLSVNTPAYAGGKGMKIISNKSIDKGDSCNQIFFSMSNHLGTHVDAPAHFIKGGETITDYNPDDWIFNCCCLIDCPCYPGQIIDESVLINHDIDDGCDLLLIKTGFERYRQEDVYWKESPVFHENLGLYFEKHFPKIKAIGFDTISLSSMTDRDMGKAAHRAILSLGIRIFEDVALSNIVGSLRKVTAYPLMLDKADGAQVTMVGICD